MKPVLAVVVGGLVGSGARLLLDTLVPHPDDGFPVSTFLINLAGSLALGLVVARVWPVAPDWLRAGLGAGLLGSFTTFSALALSVVQLGDAGEPGVAAAYLGATLVGGFAAAAVGLRLGTPRGRREPDRIGPDE